MTNLSIEELIESMVKNRQPTLADITRDSVNTALHELLHSETKGFADYIDTDKINKGIKEVIGKKKKLYESDMEEIRKNITEGIKGGRYLTEKGQRILLQEAIKPRNLWEKIKYTFSGQPSNYISKAAKVSSQLYDLIKIGGYNLPEIEAKAQELKDLGFYKAALGILNEEGLISGHSLGAYEKEVKEKAKRGLAELTEMVRYGAAAKTAQIILAIAGIFLLGFSSANLTGFVIGGRRIASTYTIAWGFIFLVITLFLSAKKHKPTKKQSKHNK